MKMKIYYPPNLNNKNEEFYGHRRRQINAGINDGDTVIIKETSTTDSGKIVVALNVA